MLRYSRVSLACLGAGCAGRVDAEFACNVGHGLDVLDAGIVLDDGAGVHDVAAVLCHAVDDSFAAGADVVRRAVAEERVGHAAAEAELVAQLLVRLEDVCAVGVEDDAGVGKLGEAVEMVAPVTLGVKEDLVAAAPEFLDDWLERGPVVRVELFRPHEGHAAAVHPEADGYVFVGICARQRHVQEVRHERLARRQHFLRLMGHVHRQADVAAQLVGEDVEWSLEYAGDG